MSRRAIELGREAVPMLLPLAMAPWLASCIRNYVGAVMYGDIEMFNYAAWCLRHGQRMYVDFAMPDGPLVFVIQAILQSVCGTSARALQAGDLVFQAAVGAAIGGLVVPAAPERARAAVRRVAWALAGAAVWVALPLELGWQFTMEREVYYAGLGLVALALAYASDGRSRSGSRVMLAASGSLAGLEPLGKHTGVVYVALLLLLVAQLQGPLGRRTRLLTAAAGAVAGFASLLALVAVTGSLRVFWFWYVRYDLEVYRLAWQISYGAVLKQERTLGFLASAAVALVLGAMARRLRIVPATFAALFIGSLLHFAAAVAQRRDLPYFAYYFIPAAASANMCLLALMAATWCRSKLEPPNAARDLGLAVLPVLLALRFQLDVMHGAYLDPAEAHATHDLSVDALATADVVKAHTQPNDRVFYYGGQVAVVFHAARLPASAYTVEWMLDYRGALRNPTLTAAQRGRVLALQKEVQADACERLLRKPAAIVVMETSQWGWTADSVQDLVDFCPALGALLHDDYEAVPRVGFHRIFFRSSRTNTSWYPNQLGPP